MENWDAGAQGTSGSFSQQAGIFQEITHLPQFPYFPVWESVLLKPKKCMCVRGLPDLCSGLALKGWRWAVPISLVCWSDFLESLGLLFSPVTGNLREPSKPSWLMQACKQGWWTEGMVPASSDSTANLHACHFRVWRVLGCTVKFQQMIGTLCFLRKVAVLCFVNSVCRNLVLPP